MEEFKPLPVGETKIFDLTFLRNKIKKYVFLCRDNVSPPVRAQLLLFLRKQTCANSAHQLEPISVLSSEGGLVRGLKG